MPTVLQGRRRGGSQMMMRYKQNLLLRLLAYDPEYLAAYWPLTEEEGVVADNAEGTKALDGTIDNVSLNRDTLAELPVGLWDSASSARVVIPHAALASAMDEAEFTLQMWVKVSSAEVWTNGSTEEWLSFQADLNNRIRAIKLSISNRVDLAYSAGGVNKTIATTSITTTDYMHWCLTVSKSNDRMRVYLNGAQSGADATGLGTWSGAFTQATIGSLGSALYANMYAGHPIVWNREFTAAEVLELANLPN